MKQSTVIVCYEPDIAKLDGLCKTLIEDGFLVILINNGDQLNGIVSSDNLILNNLGRNHGIAYAQNVGIEIAKEHGAEIIVFFDQDSVINRGFAEKLTEPLSGIEYGVTSPVFYDEQKGFEFPSYILTKRGLAQPIWNERNSVEPYLTELIISSGSAVTIKTFEKVGNFEEDFFIDFVDLEWALRCKKLNVPIWVVPNAVMKHSIGEKSFNLGLTRIFIHGPIRSYYKLRNSILLLRMSAVPKLFAIKEIMVALIHQFIALFLVKSKGEYLKMYFKAIFDGLLDKRGEMKS